MSRVRDRCGTRPCRGGWGSAGRLRVWANEYILGVARRIDLQGTKCEQPNRIRMLLEIDYYAGFEPPTTSCATAYTSGCATAQTKHLGMEACRQSGVMHCRQAAETPYRQQARAVALLPWACKVACAQTRAFMRARAYSEARARVWASACTKACARGCGRYRRYLRVIPKSVVGLRTQAQLRRIQCQMAATTMLHLASSLFCRFVRRIAYL